MEYWDQYDKERCKTGRLIQRGKALGSEDLHLVVHICIFNLKGEMLIQRRQKSCRSYSGMWDLSAGGSAIAGETSWQAAQRELMEELGYQADLSRERPYLTMNFLHGFDDYYFIEDEVNLHNLNLQKEEVMDVKWASSQEIIQMMAQGRFIPYHETFVQFLFEGRRSRGAHLKFKKREDQMEQGA